MPSAQEVSDAIVDVVIDSLARLRLGAIAEMRRPTLQQQVQSIAYLGPGTRVAGNQEFLEPGAAPAPRRMPEKALAAVVQEARSRRSANDLLKPLLASKLVFEIQLFSRKLLLQLPDFRISQRIFNCDCDFEAAKFPPAAINTANSAAPASSRLLTGALRTYSRRLESLVMRFDVLFLQLEKSNNECGRNLFFKRNGQDLLLGFDC